MTDSLKTKATEQLKRDEGTGPVKNGRIFPYHDTVGKLTLGYGRNLDDKGISFDEAQFLVANDVVEAWTLLVQKLSWAESLDEARQGVLLNMAFNIGVGGLSSFVKMLLYMRTARWSDAAKELLASKYAQQVGDRAVRLAKQLESGVWQ